jgi:hypothetical protein
VSTPEYLRPTLIEALREAAEEAHQTSYERRYLDHCRATNQDPESVTTVLSFEEWDKETWHGEVR